MLISQTRGNLWSNSKGKMVSLDKTLGSCGRWSHVGSKSKSEQMRITTKFAS